MVISFVARLLFAALCMWLGYQTGYKRALGNCLTSYPVSNSTDVSFTYCRTKDVKEAFQANSEHIPAWAFDQSIDILISPTRKIVVHRQDGTQISAETSDYLIKDSAGKFSVCPAFIFEKTYSKINAE